MNKLVSAVNSSVQSFVKDEEGAQVVEYALIIALVSIVLAMALADKTNGLGGAFAALITRVKSCFATGATTC